MAEWPALPKPTISAGDLISEPRRRSVVDRYSISLGAKRWTLDQDWRIGGWIYKVDQRIYVGSHDGGASWYFRCNCRTSWYFGSNGGTSRYFGCEPRRRSVAVLWFFDLLVRWPKSVTLRIGKVGVVIHFVEQGKMHLRISRSAWVNEQVKHLHPRTSESIFESTPMYRDAPPSRLNGRRLIPHSTECGLIEAGRVKGLDGSQSWYVSLIRKSSW